MFQRFLIGLFLTCSRRPATTLLLLAALVFGSGAALKYLRFADLQESFFSGKGDEWSYYKDLTRAFVTDQIIVVGLEPPGDLYSAEALAIVRELSQKLEAIPHVDSITDITSVKYFAEGTDTFSSEPLVPDPIPTDPAALQRIKTRALDEPLYVGGIVSTDGKMASIHVRIADGIDSKGRGALVDELERIVGATVTAHPGWRVALSGDPLFTHYHQIYMARDLALLIPLTMALLFAVMLAVMRRFRGSVLALIGSGAFMVIATAALVVTNASMNNTTTMVPPFAFIMAVTVIIHFFTEYRLNFMRSKAQDVALHNTIEELSGPVYYANFSTAIGFLSLAVSDIPAIREFGVAMALGMVLIVFVMMSYSAAVGRLVPPPLLTKLNTNEEEKSLLSVRLLERLGAHVFRHRVAWLVLIASSSAVTLYGASKIQVETNMLEMFHERDRLVQDAEYYGSRFGGVSSLYIAVDGGQADVLSQPRVLRQIEEIQTFLKGDLGAGYSVSPASFIKTMHRAFFSGDASHYSIPDDVAAVSQLLLINTDDTLRDVLNENASRGVVVAWTDEHSSGKLLRMKERLEGFLAGLPDVGVKYRVSGTVMLDTQLIDSVARSTFQSFIIAMLVIFLLRLVQFRDLKLGALSLLPNAFPIWTTFGFMGLVGIPLNVSTAMSATVTLGIADDETIHFFAGYQQRRKQGMEPRQAVLETLKDKGSGILFSTLVISVGFSTLLLSNYGPTMWFGLVLAISLLFSIFANLVFGPALLDLVRPLSDTSSQSKKMPSSTP